MRNSATRCVFTYVRKPFWACSRLPGGFILGNLILTKFAFVWRANGELCRTQTGSLFRRRSFQMRFAQGRRYENTPRRRTVLYIGVLTSGGQSSASSPRRMRRMRPTVRPYDRGSRDLVRVAGQKPEARRNQFTRRRKFGVHFEKNIV